MSAIIGGILAIVLTPVFATSYLEPDEDAPTPLIDAIRPSLESLLDFGSTERVYRTYGVVYLICAVLMFYGFFVFRDRLASAGRDNRQRGLTVLIVGWVLFLVGLFGDYAIGDTFGDVLYNTSFLVDMIGMLGILIGCTMVGLRLRGTDAGPLLTWVLILVIPIGIVGTILFGHLPSGPMLGVCLASIVIGYTLASGRGLPSQPG